MATSPSPVLAGPLEIEAFCYGPLTERLDVRELAASERAQRWSDAGAPTVYLASDIGVALAEWGRHVPLGTDREDSALWRVPVHLSRVVDLRPGRPGSLRFLAREGGDDGRGDDGRADDTGWYLDQETTRDLAARLRYEERVDGLVVPSVAFLDDPSRGNIVVFVHDARPIEELLGEPRRVATVRWAALGPAVPDLDTSLQVPARSPLVRV